MHSALNLADLSSASTGGYVGAGGANVPLLITTNSAGSSLAHVKRIGQSNGGFKMPASRDDQHDTGFSVVNQMTADQHCPDGM